MAELGVDCFESELEGCMADQTDRPKILESWAAGGGGIFDELGGF